MEKSVTVKAGGVELATEKALQELGVSKDKVKIEVLSKGGLFQKAEVKVTVVETVADAAEEFVNGILEKMGLSSRGHAEEEVGVITVTVSGEDSGSAIGYRGEALDAIQFLTRTYINQEKQSSKKIVVDCENYREKRKETLTALALRLAEKAHRTCRKVALEPMNPFPKGVEIREDRPGNGRRNGRKDNRRSGRDGKGDRRGNRSDRNSDDRRRQRASRSEEEEVPDGREYRGYYTDSFTKAEAPKSGPPKFKSFGGTKKF